MTSEVNYKQFVVVVEEPEMEVGKIAEQVAHSCMRAIEGAQNPKDLSSWKEEGRCIVVLGVRNPFQLVGIKEYLDKFKIANFLYFDGGYGSVKEGTPTCLATEVIGKDKWRLFSGMRLFNK